MRHEALIYRSHDELERRLREFVSEAATRSEPTLAVLPPPSLDVLRRAAGELRLELRLQDAVQVARNPAVMLELIEHWVSSHAGPVRMISELIWPGRRRAEVVEVLRHEALVAEQLQAAPLRVLCPFDLGQLEEEAIEGARLTHPALIHGDGRREARGSHPDPAELLDGSRWPQDAPRDPVVELPFEGDLHQLRRRVASQELVEALPAERRENLVFAVNEAVTNSIKHADGRCRVRLWHDGAAVVAEIRTRSRLREHSAGRRRPDVHAYGGRGLWLANQLCDLVEVRSKKDETWVRVHALDGSVPQRVPWWRAGRPRSVGVA